MSYPLVQPFTTEDVKVLITHIAGTSGSYSEHVKELIDELSTRDTGLWSFTHIQGQISAKRKLLHINPGAAGVSGFHHVITMIRLEIDGSKIQNLEVLELPRKLAYTRLSDPIDRFD